MTRELTVTCSLAHVVLSLTTTSLLCQLCGQPSKGKLPVHALLSFFPPPYCYILKLSAASHLTPSRRATTSGPNRYTTPLVRFQDKSLTSNDPLKSCSQMGLTIKKVDVNIAAGLLRDPTVKSDNKVSKPYRTLKVSDIPIIGESELTKWDLLVRGVLDWAGTLPDPFGTNEHPDLLCTAQALWDMCLPERKEDVSSNVAIKKVVRLFMLGDQ